MTATATGLDAGSQVPLVDLKGHQFVCLYLAPGGPSNWKVRTRSVVSSYITNGYAVVFNWESDGTPGTGTATGVNAAQQAIAQLNSYGYTDSTLPVYFNFADRDPATINYGLLDKAIQGASSVIGANRTGAYGGYGVIKHLFDAGLIKWGWQTYAWSGGKWDPRAQLRQVKNTASVDYNEAWATDYGQYPRPFTNSAFDGEIDLVLQDGLATGENSGTIICPTGLASDIVDRSWLSIRCKGGGTAQAWFQTSKGDANGLPIGAGKALTNADGTAIPFQHSQRLSCEIPSGTEYVEYHVVANGPGAIAVELRPHGMPPK